MISYQLAWEIISVLHPTELLFRWHTQKMHIQICSACVWKGGMCRSSSRGQVSTIDGSTQELWSFPAGQAIPAAPSFHGLTWFSHVTCNRDVLPCPASGCSHLRFPSKSLSLCAPFQSQWCSASSAKMTSNQSQNRELGPLLASLFDRFISSHKKKTIQHILQGTKLKWALYFTCSIHAVKTEEQ